MSSYCTEEKGFHQSVIKRIRVITGTRTQTELAAVLEIRVYSNGDMNAARSATQQGHFS